MPPFIIDMNKKNKFQHWAFKKIGHLVEVVVYGVAFGLAISWTGGVIL